MSSVNTSTPLKENLKENVCNSKARQEKVKKLESKEETKEQKPEISEAISKSEENVLKASSHIQKEEPILELKKVEEMSNDAKEQVPSENLIKYDSPLEHIQSNRFVQRFAEISNESVCCKIVNVA